MRDQLSDKDREEDYNKQRLEDWLRAVPAAPAPLLPDWTTIHGYIDTEWSHAMAITAQAPQLYLLVLLTSMLQSSKLANFTCSDAAAWGADLDALQLVPKPMYSPAFT